jgi:hypothetical protein
LTLIDPHKGIVPGSPFQYAANVDHPRLCGYDDVVFLGGKIYLSYTNPTGPNDPTIQRLENGSNPLEVSPILKMGATGVDLATGKSHQPTLAE